MYIRGGPSGHTLRLHLSAGCVPLADGIHPACEKIPHSPAGDIQIDFLAISDSASPNPLEHFTEGEAVVIYSDFLHTEHFADIRVHESVDHISNICPISVNICSFRAQLKKSIPESPCFRIDQLFFAVQKCGPDSGVCVPARYMLEEILHVVPERFDVWMVIPSCAVP